MKYDFRQYRREDSRGKIVRNEGSRLDADYGME
jgi:hypothetical protein